MMRLMMRLAGIAAPCLGSMPAVRVNGDFLHIVLIFSHKLKSQFNKHDMNMQCRKTGLHAGSSKITSKFKHTRRPTTFLLPPLFTFVYQVECF